MAHSINPCSLGELGCHGVNTGCAVDGVCSLGSEQVNTCTLTGL